MVKETLFILISTDTEQGRTIEAPSPLSLHRPEVQARRRVSVLRAPQTGSPVATGKTELSCAVGQSCKWSWHRGARDMVCFFDRCKHAPPAGARAQRRWNVVEAFCQRMEPRLLGAQAVETAAKVSSESSQLKHTMRGVTVNCSIASRHRFLHNIKRLLACTQPVETKSLHGRELKGHPEPARN